MQFTSKQPLEERIRESFFSLLEAKRYSAIRVTTIMQLSGTCHQTFYRFYQNKADLAVKVFSSQLANAITVSGKNATFREIMMIILTIIKNNGKLYSHLLCDEEGIKLLPEVLSQLSENWTGYKPQTVTTVINSHLLADWANNHFDETIEQTYMKLINSLPACELLTPEELTERVGIYERQRKSDFVSR